MSRLVAESTPEARLRDLERRVETLERRTPASLAFSDGTRIRVRLGEHSDGKFGLRVWNASGSLIYDYTT